MELTAKGETCSVCAGEAVIKCDGCGRALCEKCRIFDLWSYGCGHIDPKAFCEKCHEDIEKNPWGGKRPDEKA